MKIMITKILEWFKISTCIVITALNIIIASITIIFCVTEMFFINNQISTIKEMQNIVLERVHRLNSQFNFPVSVSDDKEMERQWKRIRVQYNNKIKELRKSDPIGSGHLSLMPEENLVRDSK
jgi:hypothetical protein